MLSTIQTPAPIVGTYVGHLLYDIPINTSVKSSKNSYIAGISNSITSSSSCVNDDTNFTKLTDETDLLSYPHVLIGQLDIHDICYKEFNKLSIHQLYHHHYSYDEHKSNKHGKMLYHILSSRRMMNQRNNSSHKLSSNQINKRTHSSNNLIVNRIDDDENDEDNNTGNVDDQGAVKPQNIHTKEHDSITHNHSFRNDNGGDSSDCLISNICDAHGIKINSYKGLKSLTGSS